MRKFVVFVEGKADANFIRDLLKYLYGNLELVKDNKNEKELNNNEINIKILVIGGYTAIKKYLQPKLNEYVDSNYKIIVIQDADNIVKDSNNGGKELRLKYLREVKEELNIVFDVFLFPNHKDDGDLEKLLLKIVVKEHFSKSFSCYKSYADSLSEFAPKKHSDELLKDKNIIFSYFRTFQGMQSAKEENRIFSSKFWDFTNKELYELKLFLKRTIN